MWLLFGKDRSLARLILSKQLTVHVLVNISLPNERSLPNHVLVSSPVQLVTVRLTPETS